MKGAIRRAEATHGGLEGEDVFEDAERCPEVPEQGVDGTGLKWLKVWRLESESGLGGFSGSGVRLMDHRGERSTSHEKSSEGW